ncbi:MAG TPA: 3-hydroxyisobutyrate dehydrogenase [Stellaceae bacterium]|nr:3-hydroxyisobutyrate dehydrogenase [Stellaceae bacterium]
MSEIGFIGVGNMGGPMVRNLIKAGHRVTVFDLAPAAVERCVAVGAVAAASAVTATRERDIVITMLPAGRHVREVYLDANGILAAARPDTLMIDSSTIDVATAREVGAAAATAGLPMIDAPVSGGVGGAEAATLTFMVGGPDAAFARAKPILETMGKTIVHAGPSGSGQAAKICNNMILGISMIGVCEAFVLAEKLGLDRQKLFDISSKSSGQCWSLTSYCPVPGPVPTSPANRDYAAGFTADMMLKDLRLSQDAAATAHAATALGAHAAQLYEMFAGSGQGAKDFSGIIEMIRKK